MSLTSPPFPTAMPKDYRGLADEPAFDPVRHLALEAPLQTWTLADFGYDDAVAAATPSSLSSRSVPAAE